MPFADKASRDPAKTLLPGVRDAPDPNIGLYGKDNPAGIVASGPTATGTTPLPGTGTSVNGQTANGQSASGPSANKDDLGTLIANLGKTPSAPTAKETQQSTNTQTVYYLQAGAFHSNADAQADKARILRSETHPSELQSLMRIPYT